MITPEKKILIIQYWASTPILTLPLPLIVTSKDIELPCITIFQRGRVVLLSADSNAG
jgi:hypothetical protein